MSNHITQCLNRPAVKKPPYLSRALNIFVLSGPGGAGKTTLVKRLFRRRFIKDNFIRGISFTTRGKRRGEKTGRDYFFISKEKFLALKKRGCFLETQRVINDYYGTPKKFCALAKKETSL